MKQHKIKLFVWSILATLVLLAVISFFQSGTKIIGENYVDTTDFRNEMDNFYNNIGPAVINQLDIEEVKKSIPVYEEEIEEHRYRYGTLSDQIENIHDQYESRIIGAKDANNKVLEEALIKERDTKITDIQGNFESNEHIKAKIKAEKVKEIERYIDEVKQIDMKSFPIFYKFTDIETGKTFSSGDVGVPAAYKKEFSEQKGLFKSGSIPVNYDDSGWHDNEYGETATSTWGNTIAREHKETVTVTSNTRTYSMDAAIDDISSMESLKNTVRTFEGVVVVPKTALQEGYLGSYVQDYNKMKYTSYALWILGLLSLIVLFTALRFKKEWVTETGLTVQYDKIKLDVKIFIFLITLALIVDHSTSFSNSVVYYFIPQYGPDWWLGIAEFMLLALGVAFIAFQLINNFERLKHKGVYVKDASDMYTTRTLYAIRDMFLKKTMGVQMFILLIGFFLAGIGLVAASFHPYNAVVYTLCVLFLGLPALYIFIRRAGYLNRIIVATEQMAAGRLHDEIKIEGKSPLAKHAQNLNNLREGVRSSMSEQAKSERLKTELITNVSHDLRTPLTSIITYTDLLKNENLPAEERAKYVDILDKKSQRLKTLIEDLFEVSKMASGNLELDKQRVDLTQLLQQALAEHEEEITETGLDFRISLPDDPIVAYIDGKRWWRVLDNLIVNAIKYTLPGTRVYITLRKLGNSAEFVVKNVTKYELGENTDELFERFKRADTSRHTDGSGLGLAIAQSIVDMHLGTMQIEVDGDLFKVTVTVPVAY